MIEELSLVSSYAAGAADPSPKTGYYVHRGVVEVEDLCISG
jgi:hypothetical protein